MSVEVLMQPEQSKDHEENLSPELAYQVGRTVFEKLAVDAEEAFEQPEVEEDSRFISSVTRLGDGQTVPDER